MDKLVNAEKYQFHPDWMRGVVQRASQSDPYLQECAGTVEFLLAALPHCHVAKISINPEYPTNVTFDFEETLAPPVESVAIAVPFSIRIYGDEADLGFYVSEKRKISYVEVWFRSR